MEDLRVDTWICENDLVIVNEYWTWSRQSGPQIVAAPNSPDYFAASSNRRNRSLLSSVAE
jgi:hypothetical protein